MARIPAAERRKDFVVAAVHVIAEHGVDGATTRRIADRAGAAPALVRYCFSSKELLFAAVHDHLARELHRVIAGADVDGGLAAAAHEILRRVTTHYLRAPDHVAASVELINWARRQNVGGAATVYEQAYRAARGTLEAAAQGEVVGPRVTEQIAHVLSVMSDGFAVNWLTFADRATAARQADILVDLLDTFLSAQAVARVPAPCATATAPECRPKMSALLSWVEVE
ncbi:TetR/AcrR family transcriptional regulator [Nocardia asteroides]|uniref:TetR/AcrR family transcriptional regulator n=1 Tax=Nocardia asteroides TaxID=1824 RepID=UPI001E398880|nr:TetR/AcrR family transcriptional regulator [Nocardia asteroides]UGT55956.1 TetR/AcrR family transcriptional regulator [Nocardia asteroides]